MRLADVNGQKIGVILVIVEDLYYVADLATEGRSSEAAEDHDQWPSGGTFANVKRIGTVQSK
jgi:hypothetical protein